MNMFIESIRLILCSCFSNRAISIMVGLSHTTVSKYRKILYHLGLSWSDINDMDYEEVENLFRKKRKNESKKRLPDFIYFDKEMKHKNMTIDLLWQDYCLVDSDTAYSYSSVAYMYKRYKRKLDLSMRQSHRAGECIFVDFAGTTVVYTDIKTGAQLKAQIFVSALGCSNYTFACAVRSQGITDWVDAHNKMFMFYGGIPETIVPDNLKSAVIRAGKNLELNRTYLELCRYYGTVVLPARVRKPKDKAKAEVAVKIVSRWILARLRHHKFFSVEEINNAIKDLLWQLNERPFKKLPGCRRSRFEELDKPLLKPCPGTPFEFAEWVGRQKVGPDYHARIMKHHYSVPHELVGEYVEARVTKNMVEILNKGRRVASHPRSYFEGSHTTIPAHQPAAHRHYAELTPETLLKWAERIGPACLAAVNNQFKSKTRSVLGLKACSALQRLDKEYGSERFEAACQRAESIGSLTVKSIKSILRNKITEHLDGTIPMQINLPLHENVRGSQYYSNKGV